MRDHHEIRVAVCQCPLTRPRLTRLAWHRLDRPLRSGLTTGLLGHGGRAPDARGPARCSGARILWRLRGLGTIQVVRGGDHGALAELVRGRPGGRCSSRPSAVERRKPGLWRFQGRRAHGEQFGSRIRCRSRWTEIRTPRDRIGQYDAVDEERAFYIRSPPAFASVSHRELVSCRRAVADVARARFRRGSSTPSKRWSRLCVRGDRMPAARAAHCPGQRDKGRLSNDD